MLNNSEGSFFLSKWYVDLIDSAGNLFVIYIGRIKFGRLNIYYSSLLNKPTHERSREIYTIKKYDPPEINNDTFCWKSRDLKLELKFSQAGHSVGKELIELPEGYISWHCLHTRSAGEIVINNKEFFNGLGYVERLDMTIKPWSLPFNELRWGRFISEESSVIWIDYKGSCSRSLLLHGNEEYNDPVFYENKVAFNAAKDILLFNSSEDIRKGEIISSTFSKVPLINKIIPPGLLKIFEHKSVARADLVSNEKPASTGWALYEVVKWL